MDVYHYVVSFPGGDLRQVITTYFNSTDAVELYTERGRCAWLIRSTEHADCAALKEYLGIRSGEYAGTVTAMTDQRLIRRGCVTAATTPAPAPRTPRSHPMSSGLWSWEGSTARSSESTPANEQHAPEGGAPERRLLAAGVLLLGDPVVEIGAAPYSRVHDEGARGRWRLDIHAQPAPTRLDREIDIRW